MRRRSAQILGSWILLALCGAGMVRVAAAETLDPERFRAHVAALTAAPHRLAGTTEAEQAAAHIEKELRALAGTVLAQSFAFPQEMVEICELRTEGGVIPLQPLRANGLQPSVTPEDGFTGRLVAFRSGGAQAGPEGEAAGSAEDWIAVAPFSDRKAVLEAFRRGARAIIFVGRDPLDRADLGDKQTSLSIDLPRFYLSGTDAERHGLDRIRAGTLVSRVHWEKRAGRNLFLWIPGTAPRLGRDRDEFLILSAPYDSRGLVPRNCPDAPRAANCAALLEIARRLAHQPPKRSVLVAFFDNHANFLQGGREFYAAYRRAIAEGVADPWPKRREFIAQEREYLNGLLAFLAEPDILASTSELCDRGLQILQAEAKYRYDNYQERMSQLRLTIHRLQTQSPSPEESVTERGERIRDLRAQLEQQLAERRGWQKTREALRDRAEVGEEGREAFAGLLCDTAEALRKRQAELDEVERNAREGEAIGALLREGSPVVHVALRFSGGSDRWLFLPHVASQKRLFLDLMKALPAVGGADIFARLGFVTEAQRLWEFSGDWKLSQDGAGAHAPWWTEEEAILGGTFEIPGMTLVTEQDRAPQACMPDAAVPAETLERIRAQSAAFLPFLDVLANDASASLTYRVLQRRKFFIEDYEWKGDRADGHAVKSFAFGQTEAERVEAQVVIHCVDREDEKQEFGLRPEYYVLSDMNGIFPLMPLFPSADDDRAWVSMLLEAARFDAAGRIVAITALRPEGGVASVGTGWAKAGSFRAAVQTGHYAILTMFQCEAVRLLGYGPPFRGAFQANAFRILNGLSNSIYPHMHFRFDSGHGFGACYVEKPMGLKLIYMDPRDQDNVAVYTNPTEASAAGVGYGPGVREAAAVSAGAIDLETASARDLFVLNETRLDTLRRKNIVMNSLEYLHSQAKAALEAMPAAEGEGARDALSASVQGCERRIYPRVIATTNDMVFAATLLLLLTIPFAFSLQSLLFATHSIYRKIVLFAVLFALTYLVLYAVHPAFSFSATPSIIILAFVIMVMSGAVVYILFNKFHYEIRKLQGLAMAAHSFDRSLLGNVGAAVALAISTMRRRPVRTGLTVVTVVMLTFTIVSFVSFEAERGVNRFYKGTGDACSRLLVHDRIWKSLPERLLGELGRHLGDGYRLHGRYWRIRELAVDMKEEDLTIPVRHPDGRQAVASAVMSVDAGELEEIPGLRAMLGGGESAAAAREGIWVAPGLLETLGAEPGDTVRVDGEALTVLGVFDARHLLEVRQLSGAPLLPVNFKMTRMAMGQFEFKGSATSGDAMADLSQLLSVLEPEAMEAVNPETLLIATTQTARHLGAHLKAVVVYPDAESDLERVAEDLAVMLETPVFLNEGGERQMFVYGEKYGVSGFGDVLVPLVLGALIVFSTMLGSVIDREKEIYTFSALGLAPRNIAMLFFFEAGIYAILGGFGGYLLSQVCTRILEVLAEYGLFRSPEINYSSSAAINTILIVMATVIASTIYPAVQAARRATAEARGRWRVPPPEGDRCVFEFPFTISEFDIGGIMCFIQEYFRAHADRTVGAFAADGIEIVQDFMNAALLIRELGLQRSIDLFSEFLLGLVAGFLVGDVVAVVEP